MFDVIKKRGVIEAGVFFVLFILLNIIAVSILTNNVYAFGISTPYLKDNILLVNSNKSYVYIITLQNGDDQDYYVDLIYSSTDNMVSVKQTSFYAQAETYDTKVYFEFIIPADAKIGQEYVLDYVAKPRTNNSDIISSDLEIARSIKIVVEDNSEDNSIQNSLQVLTTNSTIDNQTKEDIEYSFFNYMKNYFLVIVFILVLILLVLIIFRLWRVSQGISMRLFNKRVTTYTITESNSFNALSVILEKMTDEEFMLEDIKTLVMTRFNELAISAHISCNTQDFFKFSRSEIIRNIKQITKNINVENKANTFNLTNDKSIIDWHFLNNYLYMFLIRKNKTLIAKELFLLKKSYDIGFIPLKEYLFALQKRGYIIDSNSNAIITPKNLSETKVTLTAKEYNLNKESLIQKQNLSIQDSNKIIGITKNILDLRTEDKAFILANGERFNSLRDLMNALPNMPLSIIKHHVSYDKNDFANWAKEVFNNSILFKELSSANNREELLDVLRKYD
jgi:hypothetical protein